MAHVEKQPSGRYKARYRIPDGHERSRTFDRKGDAERFLVGVESDKLDHRWVDPRLGRTTLAAWAGEVMGNRPHLRPASRTRDESYLRSHVLAAFGDARLGTITRKDIQDWIRALSEKGLAPRTVKECRRILRGIMAEAVLANMIGANPCDRVSLPRIEHEEANFLAPDQVTTLADTVGPRHRALILTAAYLGPRWGELAGLKRTNLDLLRKELRIVGSLERVGNGWRYVEETKSTSGRRTIPLPAFLVDELAAHLASAPESEYVFPDTEGGFLRYHSFRQRVWLPAVESAGLSGLVFHELRHSAAAIAIDQGANPITVQKRLGHKDVKTTLSLYGHRYPDQDEALTSRLETVYGKAAASCSRPRSVSPIRKAASDA